MARTFTLTAIMIGLLVFVPHPKPAIGDTTSNEVTQKAEDTMQTIKAYLAEKQKEAVEYGKSLLEKADEEIAVLEGKAANSSGDAKKAYQEEIKNLKQKRAVAAKKLDELENASGESWDSAKQGFADAYKALYEAYKEALTKFK